MPTYASVFPMDTRHKQLIGNWQDVPNHDEKGSNDRAQFVMSSHYAGHKEAEAAIVKGMILAGIAMRWKLGCASGELVREAAAQELEGLRTLFIKGTIGLNDLQAEWLSAKWANSTKPAEAHRSTLLIREGAITETPSHTEHSDMSADSESGDESGSTDTSSSSDAAQVRRSPVTDLTTAWFVQDGCGKVAKLHFSAFIDFDGYNVPYCKLKSKDVKFSRKPTADGTSVTRIPPGVARCKDCETQLPRRERSILDLHFEANN